MGSIPRTTPHIPPLPHRPSASDPDGVGAYEDGGEEEEEGEVDPMDVFNLVEILEEGVGATVFRGVSPLVTLRVPPPVHCRFYKRR